MDFTLQEKAKLIEFFEFLLNTEIDKPLGEMNSEAVDNYIKILLFLQDNNVELSSEFIDEQVRKLFHKEEATTVISDTVKTKKNYFNKKKVWLVAACIAVLVALFSVASFSSDRSVKDILVEFLGSFELIPYGKEIIDGNVSYGKGNTKLIYNSVEELVKNEKISIFYPSENIVNIEHISVGKSDQETKISLTFDKSDLYETITLNAEIPPKVFSSYTDKFETNGLDCYICIMSDVNQAQAYFLYGNNLYVVTHTDKNDLVETLENLKEIKYED